MSAAQDAWVSISGVRLGGWAGCGAQGGYRVCVWGGVEGEEGAYIICCVIWGAHGGERMVCICAGRLGVLQSIWHVRVIVQEG